MNTHLVHFSPIAVPKKVAEELSSPDPLGERMDLEVELLKMYAPTYVFGAEKEREPFPIIEQVTQMTLMEYRIYNGLPVTESMRLMDKHLGGQHD